MKKAEEKYLFAMKGLGKMLCHLVIIGDDGCEVVVDKKPQVVVVEEPQAVVVEEPQATNGGPDQVRNGTLTNMQDTLLDPCYVKSRERPKSLRHKNPKEYLIGTQNKRIKKTNGARSTERKNIVTPSMTYVFTVPTNDDTSGFTNCNLQSMGATSASALEVSSQFQCNPSYI